MFSLLSVILTLFLSVTGIVPDGERLYLGGDAYSAPMVYQRDNGGNWTAYNIGRDYLGSITHIASADGTPVAEYSYDPWGRLRNPQSLDFYAAGSEPELFLGRGFTGHEVLPWFGLVNMNARLYDPLLGRFLSPDPYIQSPDFTQNFNRYSYCLNNPLKYTDPSGEILWFVPIIIGSVLGGVSGYLTGKAAGASGSDMASYVLGGAAIGGLSGGAAVGVSALGGGAMLAGAAAGAVGGAGFYGLSTNWDVKAMLKGAAFGATSGFAGGGLGAAIGGGWGALVGGAVSSGLNTAFNGGNLEQIGISMLTGGLLSYGSYELISFLGWKGGGNMLGNHAISYKQYKTMQADFQRSRFFGKEYGGFLLDDGTVQRFPASWRYSHGITPSNGDSITIPENAFAMYHTHWDVPGKTIYIDSFGQRVDNSSDISSLLGNGIFQAKTARGHGAYDYLPIDSYVINRYETTFNVAYTTYLTTYNDNFLRFFPCFFYNRLFVL